MPYDGRCSTLSTTCFENTGTLSDLSLKKTNWFPKIGDNALLSYLCPYLERKSMHSSLNVKRIIIYFDTLRPRHT